ncbi:hypothetical protein QE152_g1989 [Popillia japonica]|uniref:Leucine-rich repeat-containing protein 56 n=1 Tax=Popillia japonica TaxID=7064 RepID=A0AAW1N4C0_POPJA
MPPTQNERPQDVSPPDSEIFLYPHAPSPVDLTSLSTTVSEISNDAPVSSTLYEVIEIPREPTLKELVQSATGLDDIGEATTVKLQVIAIDVSLQYLSYHTPLLQELILDGSVISSLRDLGCGLKCLKILRVNRCGLKHIDGTFGIDSLEELYATKNSIQDISPCVNLPKIRIIDVRKNCLADINALTFLTLCPVLEHMWLEENEDIVNYPQYRQTVKNLIPNLKTLDGQPFTAEECMNVSKHTEEQRSHQSPRKERIFPRLNTNPQQSSSSSSSASEGTYMVGFPPKVLSPRRQSTSSESPRDSIQVNRVLPEISQVRSRTPRMSTPSCSTERSYTSNN